MYTPSGKGFTSMASIIMGHQGFNTAFRTTSYPASTKGATAQGDVPTRPKRQEPLEVSGGGSVSGCSALPPRPSVGAWAPATTVTGQAAEGRWTGGEAHCSRKCQTTEDCQSNLSGYWASTAGGPEERHTGAESVRPRRTARG